MAAVVGSVILFVAVTTCGIITGGIITRRIITVYKHEMARRWKVRIQRRIEQARIRNQVDLTKSDPYYEIPEIYYE